MYFNRKERRNWWKLRIDWFVQTFWKETRFWFRLVFVRRAAIGRAATGAVQSAATLHLCFSHCQGERKMQKHMESVYKSIYNRYAETHTHTHTHTNTILMEGSIESPSKKRKSSLEYWMLKIQLELEPWAFERFPHGCTWYLNFRDLIGKWIISLQF